jgi:hypothetical protein
MNPFKSYGHYIEYELYLTCLFITMLNEVFLVQGLFHSYKTYNGLVLLWLSSRPMSKWHNGQCSSRNPLLCSLFSQNEGPDENLQGRAKKKRPADFWYQSKLQKRMSLIHSDYGLVPQRMSLIDPDSFLFVCSSTGSALSLPLCSLSSLCGFVSVAARFWFFPGLCCSPTWQSKTPCLSHVVWTWIEQVWNRETRRGALCLSADMNHLYCCTRSCGQSNAVTGDEGLSVCLFVCCVCKASG